MSNQDLFKTYFFVGLDKISIYVRNNDNFDIVFFKTKNFDKNIKYLDNYDLQLFFEEKIDEIENQINFFVENITLIIEEKNIFSIRLSLKQEIDNREISDEELTKLLSSSLQQIYKYHPKNFILHYIIEKVNIDGEKLDSLQNKFIKNYLCLDLRFICIEQKLIEEFKNLLKKKQIFLDKVFSAKYLNEFSKNEDDIIKLAYKIEAGLNKLEIQLVPKKREKNGFFESFFLSI